MEDSTHNAEDLTAGIRKKIQKGTTIFFIDNLRMVQGQARRSLDSQSAPIFLTDLRDIASGEAASIILLVELEDGPERRGGDKRPRLSDLNHCPAIKTLAHQILFLYRPAYYGLTEDEDGKSLLDIAEIIVAKNQGPLGAATLRCDLAMQWFGGPMGTP